jgi:hypothetical protein
MYGKRQTGPQLASATARLLTGVKHKGKVRKKGQTFGPRKTAHIELINDQGKQSSYTRVSTIENTIMSGVATPPLESYCRIPTKVMHDPVIITSGLTYEREYI